MRRFRLFKAVMGLAAAVFLTGAISGCQQADSSGVTATETDVQEEPELESQGSSPEIHFYLVRSGHTILDQTGRVQGWADSPLSHEGVLLAGDTALGLADIRFDLVYSSDRLRDTETADTIIEMNQVSRWQAPVILEALRPMNLGRYEGEYAEVMWTELKEALGSDNWGEVLQKEKPIEQFSTAVAAADEAGEAGEYPLVSAGYQEALNQMVAEAGRVSAENVLVAADEYVICDILGQIDEGTVKALPHNSVIELLYKDGNWSVVDAGITSYSEAGSESRASSENGEVVIYLIRHGKTIFNTNDRVQGWSDSPLTAEGVEVAENLGKGLADIPFSAAYTSDLGRTVETAQLVLKHNSNSSGLKINKIPGLRETYYGKYEAGWNEDMNQASYDMYQVSSWDEISAMDHSVEKVLTAVHAADENAENYEQMSDRVSAAFRDLVEAEAEKGGGNVLIVSHGHAIMAIMNQVGNTDVTKVENSAVCKLVYRDGEYTVESVNDKSYIEKGAEK